MLIGHCYLHNVEMKILPSNYSTLCFPNYKLLFSSFFFFFSGIQKVKLRHELQKRCTEVVIWIMLYIPGPNHHFEWDVNNWDTILWVELGFVRFINESFHELDQWFTIFDSKERLIHTSAIAASLKNTSRGTRMVVKMSKVKIPLCPSKRKSHS